MKINFVYIRNYISRFVYQSVLKPIFFCADPEKIHDRMIKFGRFLSHPAFRKVVALLFSYSNPKLVQNIAGIRFLNPIGLAAGFDKDAYLTGILPAVGFGFVEVGSITGEPCAGNPKPRLWRLKKSQGLVVYYGLKNEGCERVAERLKNKQFSIPIGISVAKTNNEKTVEVEAGINDYAKAYKAFTNIGDYYTINISCPNTFGGELFTDPELLERLLRRIDELPGGKPVFLKLSPDLSIEKIDAIINVSRHHRVAGFICSNLTKKRDNNKKIFDASVPQYGGISGKVVEEASNKLIQHIYNKTKGEFVIIGCGGVFSAEDAYKKIKLGASLVQLITGMIFKGPQVISEINQGLARLLERDGFSNISEAIGIDYSGKEV